MAKTTKKAMLENVKASGYAGNNAEVRQTMLINGKGNKATKEAISKFDNLTTLISVMERLVPNVTVPATKCGSFPVRGIDNDGSTVLERLCVNPKYRGLVGAGSPQLKKFAAHVGPEYLPNMMRVRQGTKNYWYASPAKWLAYLFSKYGPETCQEVTGHTYETFCEAAFDDDGEA